MREKQGDEELWEDAKEKEKEGCVRGAGFCVRSVLLVALAAVIIVSGLLIPREQLLRLRKMLTVGTSYIALPAAPLTEEKVPLNVEQIVTGLLSYNYDRVSCLYHEPTGPQMEIGEAIAAAKGAVRELCDRRILPSEMMENFDMSVQLDLKSPCYNSVSNELMDAWHSVWTVHFLGSHASVELVMEACTGAVLSLDCWGEEGSGLSSAVLDMGEKNFTEEEFREWDEFLKKPYLMADKKEHFLEFWQRLCKDSWLAGYNLFFWLIDSKTESEFIYSVSTDLTDYLPWVSLAQQIRPPEEILTDFGSYLGLGADYTSERITVRGTGEYLYFTGRASSGQSRPFIHLQLSEQGRRMKLYLSLE